MTEQSERERIRRLRWHFKRRNVRLDGGATVAVNRTR